MAQQIILELNLWASRVNFNGNLQEKTQDVKRTFSQLVPAKYFFSKIPEHFVGNPTNQQMVVDLAVGREKALWSWFRHSDDFLIWNPDQDEVIVVYNGSAYPMKTLVSATAHSRYSQTFAAGTPRRPDIVYRDTF